MTAAGPVTNTIWRDREALFSRARVARTPIDRMVGLLPRTSMDEDEAMVFPSCRSLHTFFMRIPIDIAFLDHEGGVVKIVPDVSSGRLVFGGPGSRTAIECGARVLARKAVALGQRLTWSAN